MEILISDERDKLLETGGGLVKALPMLGDRPFLCANSDNIWIDGPQDSIEMLASHWDDEKMDALLLLVPHARAHCHRGPGDFHMDDTGRITRRRTGRLAPFVFRSEEPPSELQSLMRTSITVFCWKKTTKR